MSDSSEQFWQFSVGVYARAGVAESCLLLQDGFGLDVNLMLCCCGIGHTRGGVKTADLERALEFSRQWREHVVQPLRNVRRWLKNAPAGAACVGGEPARQGLREQVKSIELQSEQFQ